MGMIEERPRRFVEMHRATANDEEGMLDALIGEKLYDVIGKFHYRYLS